ncbi:MAG TPA: hypothetical protein VNW90_25500 [Acetobacteraceae bacterium]|jgi:hypothetical protein|nr:hypothetical protein [Acetobacteraceae bacterium]
MAFFLDLFTPETWQGFRTHGASVSGFRERQLATANRIKPGDTFLCYLVRLSRWCGALEITSPTFMDTTPIFSDPDPFIVRFNVRPIVALDPEYAIPIFDDRIWNSLEETKGIKKGVRGWGIGFRGSLRQITTSDGTLLLRMLREQGEQQTAFPFTERDQRQLASKRSVRTLSGVVEVAVPGEDEDQEDSSEEIPSASDAEASVAPDPEARKSIQVQVQIAEIGAKMGFHIWIPPSDRTKVLDIIEPAHRALFLDALPLNYDENTLDTIRQIDVLWLKGRSMARAFEVEHTTAIYSGILRMADLLALQPNMQIRLHIVAPSERRQKVLREIKRPVFSLLDHGPLYEKCTFLSYESIHAVAQEKFLNHMSDTILDEYEEHALEE